MPKIPRKFLISAVALLISLLFVVLTQGTSIRPSENGVPPDVVRLPEAGSVPKVQDAARTPTPTETSPKNTHATETTQSDASETYVVTRVVDGDTLEVLIKDKVEKVRLIGIDTPETVDPRKPVQCFGIEASNKAKELLTGKEVRLEGDKTQGERDKYQRLLRYVYLPDGTNFNLLMIREGYAHEYTYKLPYRYQTAFKAAEKEAMQNKAGLWGAKCET